MEAKKMTFNQQNVRSSCISEESIVQVPDRGELARPWEKALTADSVSHQNNVAVKTQMRLVIQAALLETECLENWR